MGDHEIKEALSDCLTDLESALDTLETIKDSDHNLTYRYDKLLKLFEELLTIYER